MSDEPITHQQQMVRMLGVAKRRARALALMAEACLTLKGNPDEMSVEPMLELARGLVGVLARIQEEQGAELRRRSGLYPDADDA